VHHASAVRVGQRIGQPADQGDGFLDRQRPGTLAQPRPQRWPVHQLHGQEMEAGLAAVIEHAHDVGVVKLRGRLGLATKTGDEPLVVGQMGMEDLEGHFPTCRVRGLVDPSHGALAQGFDHLVGANAVGITIRSHCRLRVIAGDPL